MTNPHDFRVGDYRVWFDPPPIPTRNCDWHFQHKDDAGEVGRSGDGPTAQDCLVQIVELLSEELDTARGANRALRRFRDELHEANTAYVNRARAAEYVVRDVRARLKDHQEKVDAGYFQDMNVLTKDLQKLAEPK